MWKFENVKWI